MSDELLVTLFVGFISCENLDVNRAALEIAKRQLDAFEEKLEIEKQLLHAIQILNKNLDKEENSNGTNI